jgi:hypothetical protein
MGMEQVNRRTFMKQATAAVGVAGVAATMPALPRVLSTGTGLAVDPTPHANEATPGFDEPVVAHVANLKTGEIHLFFGEHKVTRHDRSLAAQLVQAAKK